jgi:hypothetical protein
MTIVELRTVKNKAVVTLATGEFSLFPWVYVGMDPDPPLPNDAGAGTECVEVTTGDLAGLTLREFQAQKKAVIVAGAFDSWAARDAAPVLSLDVNPKADGAVSTLQIRGGTSASTARLAFTRPVDCDLPGDTVALDVNGDADVKFRVFGLGELQVTVSPDDGVAFEAANLAITVDPGVFP